MHDLKSLEGCVGRKAERWTDQPFKLAVVGLNNVVEVLGLAMLGLLWALAFLFQFGNGDWVAAGLVDVNDVRHLQVLAPGEGFAGEGEHKNDCLLNTEGNATLDSATGGRGYNLARSR